VIKLILEERGELQEMGLAQTAITIGRTADNAIRVQDALSSRHHCRIEKAQDGWYVEDLKSRNGTTLNGQRIEGRRVLAIGDRIAIGESVIHFGARLDKSAPPKVKSQKITKPSGAGPAKTTTRQARYILKCTEGPRKDKAFPVTSFPFTVGKKKGVGLLLEEEDVSAEHCMFVEDQGEIHVVDLNSESGTFVSGKRVRGREHVPPNAIVAIGKTKFRFKDHAAKGPDAASDDEMEPAAKPISDRTGAIPAPKIAPQAEEVHNLDSLGEDEDPARTPPQGTARPGRGTAPAPPKEKTQRRVKPADAEAAPQAIAAITADETGIATTELSSVALEQGAGGGAGGAIAVVVVVIALLAAGFPVAHALLGHEDRDPAPENNLLANWSFEMEPALRNWTIEGGKVVTEGVLYGARAVRLDADDKARGKLWVNDPQVISNERQGKPLALHASVKTTGQAAGVLAIEWMNERTSATELVYAAVVESSPDWNDVGASLVPPPGTTRAKVIAFAAPLGGGSGSAFFDRISLREEADAPATPTLHGGGLELSASRRGILALSRPAQNGAPAQLLAHVWLALSAADGSSGDPLSSQVAWLTGTPAGDPGDGGLFGDGTILDTSSGNRVQTAAVVKPQGETLKVWWEIAKKDLPDGRPVRIVIDVPRVQEISPVEVSMSNGQTYKLEELFKQDPKGEYIRIPTTIEIACGSGKDQSSLRMGPSDVDAQRRGDGVRFEIIMVPEVKGDVRIARFDLAPASALAHGRIAELSNQAEAARKDGRLEEARQTYLRLAREFSHDAPVAARAKREADLLAKQADRLLESVNGAAEDAEDLGLPELAKAAHSWADALAKAFPGAPQLPRAQGAVARADEKLDRSNRSARGATARELVARAVHHREAHRNRLARTIYEYVIATFPADDPSVKDAKDRLAAMPPEED
jgi:pSer/pThr/pTyr-binding forkhead associated (FHA) protein